MMKKRHVGYCKKKSYISKTRLWAGFIFLIQLAADHKLWLKLCLEQLNNVYNVFAFVLTFDTSKIGNYCWWCTSIYFFSILMTSAVSQLASARKEIDQLDQDMQKKIKGLEQIVRYNISLYMKNLTCLFNCFILYQVQRCFSFVGSYWSSNCTRLSVIRLKLIISLLV